MRPNRSPVTACVALLLSLAVSVSAAAAPDNEHKLRTIIEGEHRSEADRARDVHRHPVETLLWMGIRDDMTVVEVTPGAGWYTDILAPFLRDHGQYYAAGFDPDSSVGFFRNAALRFRQKVEADPALYGDVKITVLAPPAHTRIAPPESADMVLTFRNVHNWMAAGTTEAIFDAVYQALKPGGILGIVEHRGDPERPQDPKARFGYVNEEYVIARAEAAGFEFVDRSDINANPRDTKDHPEGVWTLPPTLRLGDDDRERYLAIGESDRMTLKFVKPLR
ncbi:MAG: methyltransferase [Gammaproteobacteria bacterium]|jgi:predicted methyltransferase|nr:methyltransferase [Gammaproteobacteria bacterium]